MFLQKFESHQECISLKGNVFPPLASCYLSYFKYLSGESWARIQVVLILPLFYTAHVQVVCGTIYHFKCIFWGATLPYKSDSERERDFPWPLGFVCICVLLYSSLNLLNLVSFFINRSRMCVLICNTYATSLQTHYGQYSLGLKEENQSSADAHPFRKAVFKSSI